MIQHTRSSPEGLAFIQSLYRGGVSKDTDTSLYCSRVSNTVSMMSAVSPDQRSSGGAVAKKRHAAWM